MERIPVDSQGIEGIDSGVTGIPQLISFACLHLFSFSASPSENYDRQGRNRFGQGLWEATLQPMAWI